MSIEGGLIKLPFGEGAQTCLNSPAFMGVIAKHLE